MNTDTAKSDGAPSRKSPDVFEKLTKKKMLAELGRLGIGGGKRKKSKAQLVSFYREWFERHERSAAKKAPDATVVAAPEAEPAPEAASASEPETASASEAEAEAEAASEAAPVSAPAPEAEPEAAPAVAPAGVSVKDERRAAPRARIEVQIGLQTETNFFVGFSGDISEGGIFITTVALLPIGTSVVVSFSFPGGIDVDAEGDVAWTREGRTFDSEILTGMGVRFTHLSDEALAAIREFTRVREPLFYDD